VTGTPLDGFVISLLAASADSALRRWLHRAAVQSAIRGVVREAVKDSVAEVGRGLPDDEAAHVRSTLMEHELGLDARTLRVTTKAELNEALHAWMTELDRQIIDDGLGYLGLHNIEPDALADTLTRRISDGVRSNGRAGGVLNPLAEWLWRDQLDSRVGEIKRDLSYLRQAVEPTPAPQGSGLPGGVPEFTGRQQQLDLLAERILKHDPAGTVVAIHAVDGMAGVGKTELALRAAHDHKHRYPDGQYFINLHGYTEDIPPVAPAAGLEELLRQAGLTRPEIPTDLASRQARWQALMASRRALVLLDNAIDVEQVRPLLPGAAGCLVLITSRARLTDLPGVCTLPLDVLPAAEAVELFCRIAGDTDAKPDSEAVAAVAGLVGWLPVAVRAVAAQVGVDYSAAELATDLANAKQQLTLTGVAGLLGTGVAAAFDTSIQRLDAPTQQAYWILGIHPGPTIGVPQFAALAGLPIPQTVATLRRLAARNLLTPVDDQIGHRRWQQHDLLRDHSRHHAGSHLSNEQQSSALAQLTAWYASALVLLEHVMDTIGKAAAPEVEGLHLARPDQAWAWLAAERDNLLAYARHASSDVAADLCRRYGYRFSFMGYNEAARPLYHAAAGLFKRIGDQAGQADALIGLGYSARDLGEHPAARDYFQAAIVIFQEISDRGGQADALIGLGHLARDLGEHPAARDHYQAAIVIFQEIGMRAGQAAALTGIGAVAEAEGRHDEAHVRWQEAQAIIDAGSPLAKWLRSKLQESGD
jgi:hypothetical protein